jgi:hypothetical protein
MSKTTEEKIPFETVRVPDGTREVGDELNVSMGVDGKRITTTDDSGNVTSVKVTPAKNEVIYFGTKEKGEDSDVLSTGTAGDVTQGNSTESVSSDSNESKGEDASSASESDEKEDPKKEESDEDSFKPAESYKPHQSQGGFVNIGAFKSVNTTALKKAALEAGRLLVLAIPGILITVLTDNPELGGSLGATILLVLKSLDRGIHEDKSTASTGILPF